MRQYFKVLPKSDLFPGVELGVYVMMPEDVMSWVNESLNLYGSRVTEVARVTAPLHSEVSGYEIPAFTLNFSEADAVNVYNMMEEHGWFTLGEPSRTSAMFTHCKFYVPVPVPVNEDIKVWRRSVAQAVVAVGGLF